MREFDSGGILCDLFRAETAYVSQSPKVKAFCLFPLTIVKATSCHKPSRLGGLEEIDQLRRAFANVLIRRRLRKRWSQVDLGGHSGLEHSYVSRLEKGSRTPSLDVMMRLAQAFKIAPERLMKEVRLELDGLDR